MNIGASHFERMNGITRLVPTILRTRVSLPGEELHAQTLVVELYLGEVRAVEVGTLLADRDPQSGENRYPEVEYLRLAIPRRVYTNNHMDVVAFTLEKIYQRRDSIRSGYRILREAPIRRHSTVELEPVKRN